jgi:hypothetical protein
MVGLVNMSQSHIQRYAEFLARPTSSSPLPEKNLSASDIDALIAKGEEVVKSIIKRPLRKRKLLRVSLNGFNQSKKHGRMKSHYIQMLL